MHLKQAFLLCRCVGLVLTVTVIALIGAIVLLARLPSYLFGREGYICSIWASFVALLSTLQMTSLPYTAVSWAFELD